MGIWALGPRAGGGYNGIGPLAHTKGAKGPATFFIKQATIILDAGWFSLEVLRSGSVLSQRLRF